LSGTGLLGGAMMIALAGAPTRAGSVADISTPIIVAEVKSRRRSVATGSAERAAWNQAPARKNIDRHMKAVAISTQAKSDRTALSTTESKPIRRAARNVSPMPTAAPAPTPIRRAIRRRREVVSTGIGSGGGIRLRGTRGSPSAGAKP